MDRFQAMFFEPGNGAAVRDFGTGLAIPETVIMYAVGGSPIVKRPLPLSDNLHLVLIANKASVSDDADGNLVVQGPYAVVRRAAAESTSRSKFVQIAELTDEDVKLIGDMIAQGTWPVHGVRTLRGRVTRVSDGRYTTGLDGVPFDQLLRQYESEAYAGRTLEITIRLVD